jgi:hypothetical protein
MYLQFIHFGVFAPSPSYFFVLTQKSNQKKSRLQIILGLMFFTLPTQYNSPAKAESNSIAYIKPSQQGSKHSLSLQALSQSHQKFPEAAQKSKNLCTFHKNLRVRWQTPKMREPDGFGPHVAMVCATTKPSGCIFGQLFFATFFFCKKKVEDKKNLQIRVQ